MVITAQDVNKLRMQTGAGLMDCKKALVESDGDFESAIDALRKKGQKVAALRSDREATEGIALAATSEDGTKGVVVYLSSETDFVAKNDDFQAFAKNVVSNALANDYADKAALLEANIDGSKLSDSISDLVGKIGEKIDIAAYEYVVGDSIVAYNHAGNKIGVLVAFNGKVPEEIGKDIAMQIAAMNPIAVDKDAVPQSVIDREIEIGKEQALAEGKPAEIVEKIATGKLQKYFKENTLMNQQFVKDSSKTISGLLKEIDSNLTVTEFKRIAVGQ